jgi:hypothetical protein
MMIEMELGEMRLDEELGSHIIILKEAEGERCFPIYVGMFEFHFLAEAAKKIRRERPMTHDLILNVLDTLGGELKGVVIDELKDDAYIGKLLVRIGNGEVLRIDTRPSDALILAVKVGVPVFVDDEVLSSVALGREDGDDSPGDEEVNEGDEDLHDDD